MYVFYYLRFVSFVRLRVYTCSTETECRNFHPANVLVYSFCRRHFFTENSQERKRIKRETNLRIRYTSVDHQWSGGVKTSLIYTVRQSLRDSAAATTLAKLFKRSFIQTPVRVCIRWNGALRFVLVVFPRPAFNFVVCRWTGAKVAEQVQWPPTKQAPFPDGTFFYVQKPKAPQRRTFYTVRVNRRYTVTDPDVFIIRVELCAQTAF